MTTLGTLKMSNPPPKEISGVAEQAITLLGLAAKDKQEALEPLFTELKAMAENNQALLEAAAAKIKEMNLLYENVQAGAAKLDADRRTFAAEQAAKAKDTADRERAVAEREAAASVRENAHARAVADTEAAHKLVAADLARREDELSEMRTATVELQGRLSAREAAANAKDAAAKTLITTLRNIVNKPEYDV